MNPEGWSFAQEVSAVTALLILICGMFWIGAKRVRSMNTEVQLLTSLDMALMEIERALQARLYYLALVGTLMLIDICSALETEDGKTDKYVYMAWYEKHLSPSYGWLSAQDCYGLRCGMVHTGVMDHQVKNKPESHWTKVGFILPDAGGNQFRQFASNDFYFTGLAEFCRDVISRVKNWALTEKDNPKIKKNIQNLMRYHPNGIAPHIEGIGIFS
jgi:hypothetical protein